MSVILITHSNDRFGILSSFHHPKKLTRGRYWGSTSPKGNSKELSWEVFLVRRINQKHIMPGTSMNPIHNRKTQRAGRESRPCDQRRTPGYEPRSAQSKKTKNGLYSNLQALSALTWPMRAQRMPLLWYWKRRKRELEITWEGELITITA